MLTPQKNYYFIINHLYLTLILLNKLQIQSYLFMKLLKLILNYQSKSNTHDTHELNRISIQFQIIQRYKKTVEPTPNKTKNN